jgi:DNA-binding NarL/FixJ family response regulator
MGATKAHRRLSPPDRVALKLQLLTARQLEVLQLVALQRTNPQIGRLLTISPRTVQRHLEQIFLALDVHSRQEAGDIWRAESAEMGRSGA